MNKYSMQVLTNIIGGVESGGQVYGKRDYSAYAEPYKNSTKEDTITLGWAQNYGDMAQKLIKMIFDYYPNAFMNIDEGGIIEQILNYNWVKIKWYPSDSERDTLIKLISSSVGKICQDVLFQDQMFEYIADCQKEYTSDLKAIVMYCEIRHLGGKGPVDRIFKRALDYSLDSIMYSLHLDQQEENKNLVGSTKFWSRHLCCSKWADQYIKEEDIEMIENSIIICGHGSGKPSLKKLGDYLTQRYNSLAPNGKHRGLVEVRRLIGITDTQRKSFHDLYKTILNRNDYDQDLREYCYKAYTNGKYYSDCSSSGIKTFQKIGFKFPWALNTAAIHTSSQFETVPVTIVNGHVQNPELLKVGDCLLFVGNDPSRPLQIGHVEYIYEIPESEKPKEEYPKWIESGNKWYHRISEGVNAHGWRLIPEMTSSSESHTLLADRDLMTSSMPQNKHWYWFDDKGEMATGWKEIDGKWYYFAEGGLLEGALYHESDARDGSLEIWYV